jgi:Reverse transcriptase (RNA-dependent DNA polymerase)
VYAIIFGSTNAVIEKFLSLMHSEFEISMMKEFSFFLGLQINQIKGKIFVSQIKYVKELLKRFGVTDSKPSKTLMMTNTIIDSDASNKEVDITQYRTMIGSLLYFVISRPDIMF